MSSKTILSLFLVIFLSTSIFAKESDKTIPDDSIKVKYHLNPVIITATKTEDTERDIVASVSAINYSDIQNLPTSSVLEAINLSIPSIYITEWGVMGFGVAGNAAGKISVRGLGGSAATQVLILRNGRPDFMGLMGCTIADDFSTDGVERVEIIRGPASFIYGTNATGGVINLIPYQQKNEGIYLNFNGSTGTFNTKTGSASLGINKNRISSFTTISLRQTDGHRTDAESKYKGNHVTSNFTYDISDNTSLKFNASYADITVYDPGTIDDPHTDNWYDILRYGGDVTLTNSGSLGKSVVKFHGNFGNHKFYDGWKSDDRTLGVMAYNTFKPFSGNSTVVGFDYKKYGGKAENTFGDVNFGEFYVSEYGLYIHTKQIFLNRFIYSSGIRVEKSSQFGSEIIPQFGLITHISSTTSLRASAGKGFRSPSLRELYFFAPKNPDLQPEEMWNYEAGLTQYIGTGLKFDLTLYQSKGKNMIRPSNPGFPFTWVNSGEFDHTGYELSAKWIPSDFISFNVAWSQVNPGNETLYSPGKKLNAQAVLHFRSFTLFGDLIYVGDLYGADNKEKPMDDYTVVNLSIKGPLYSGFGFKVAVKNLFNKKYQSMYGYPMPGTYILGSMTFNLGK